VPQATHLLGIIRLLPVITDIVSY